MYYDKYSEQDRLTHEQSGIMGGLYQSLNIVANEYLINNENDNLKYRELLDKIEKLLKLTQSTTNSGKTSPQLDAVLRIQS